MLVVPAIDLRGGQCVRLLQGDPERQTVYSGNPLQVALGFQEAGAELIHIVDLDGAFSGRPANHGIVTDICRALTIPVEVGGGIRTADDIDRYIAAGVARVIVGTIVLTEEFKDILRHYAAHLVAGIDAKNSMVATHGWKNVSSMDSMRVIGGVFEAGLREVIYTDIATDGMLTGPNIPAMERILREFPGIQLIASGGVSKIEDIVALKRLDGLKGCIVGKAIYDGRIDLRDAIAAA
ncbi:MAG: 1-(5-phosphoribosyl)-5-[(5-phosphoribosylamino)methylideneamino]imidazole-4-carboxamide isomerase [Spirochaetes bacterium]|nr:1-(5-phosphoribosyl)-5-[(5-phosphoribosylamino)methylideneamino]imidazole-4-carboxamide isomerase [Spirochaetota bacterium]